MYPQTNLHTGRLTHIFGHDFLLHMGAFDSYRDRLAAGPNQLYPTLCGPDERFATYIEQCTKMGIVIDFDGTLSYLARSVLIT